MTDVWRGYEIEEVNNVWIFSDTKQPVSTYEDRPCGHCGKMPTKDDHDGCLGNLPDVQNACCGHGVESDAYVQFEDGRWFGGKEAIKIIEQLKNE